MPSPLEQLKAGKAAIDKKAVPKKGGFPPSKDEKKGMPAFLQKGGK